jgi:hypothetical protein
VQGLRWVQVQVQGQVQGQVQVVVRRDIWAQAVQRRD